MENQCYVVGVNRVGSDKACDYMGDSMILDAYGNISAWCKDSVEGVAAAELDMEELQRFRDKFPVLGDADEFTCATATP